MITKEQILKATGDELSRLAGEVLDGERCQNSFHRINHHHRDGNNQIRCMSCNLKVGKPHIPLTWPEAMKHFRENVYSGDYVVTADGNIKHQAMREVYETAGGVDDWLSFELWLEFYATPSDYIKAACLCKLGGE